MKSLLLAGVACIALAGSASAADLAAKSYPVKAPPIVAPVFSWTGFYLGAHVGYGWGDSDTRFEGVNTGGLSDDGWFGGFQGGYNYQFENNVVLGVEADISFGDLNDSVSGTLFDNDYHARFKTDYFGTVRGRVGYAFDTLLPYFTGGFAWGHSKLDVTVDDDLKFSDDATNTGWVIGGGVEYAFAPNWTAKVEYLYYDLGSNSYADSYLDDTFTSKIDTKFQTVRLGVNYKF